MLRPLRFVWGIVSRLLRWYRQFLGWFALGLMLVVGLMYVTHTYDWRSETPIANQILLNPPSDKVLRMKIVPEYMPYVRPFIGIAMSGGGSRAANFSWAVAKELDDIGLLKHSEALSSVSGGSIAASYLALSLASPPDKAYWDKGFDVLGQDFIGQFKSKILNPWNFGKTIFSTYDRGEMWEEVLDEMIFSGQTFSQLPSGSPIESPIALAYRPSLFINATAVNDPLDRTSTMYPDPRLPMGDFMGNFTFSYERFAQMNSDLSSLRISSAVAASSAFPGLVNPITLQLATHGSKLVTGDPTEGEGFTMINGQKFKTQQVAHSRRFVHLADGGLSDNLGVDTLRRVFEVRTAFQRTIEDRYLQRPCLIISIDATIPPVDVPRDAALRRDGRVSWWSPIVDSTAVSGYDAYLLRRRADQLDELGIDTAGFDYGSWRKTRPRAIQETEIRNRYSRYQERAGYVAAESVFIRTQRLDDSAAPLRNDISHFQCLLWHVALEDVSVRRYEGWRTAGQRGKAEANLRRNTYLSSFSQPALGIETDLRLFSAQSPRCSTSELQIILQAGARELVHDLESKKVLCDWMRKAGIDTTRCEAPRPEQIAVPTSCIEKTVPRWREYMTSEIEGLNALAKQHRTPSDTARSK